MNKSALVLELIALLLFTNFVRAITVNNSPTDSSTFKYSQEARHKIEPPFIQSKNSRVFVDYGRNSSPGKPDRSCEKIVFKLREPSQKNLDTTASRLSEIQLQKRHNLVNINTPINSRSVNRFANIKTATVRPGKSPAQLCKELAANPDVEWAEPVFYRTADLTYPDDPQFTFSNQSYLYRIRAPFAWDITTGQPDVVIAIIDTGVEYVHPDLSGNIWINTGEQDADGIDNDNNGFIDDIRGWDFVTASEESVYSGEDPGPEDNDPDDYSGHGTSVAGIAGAVGNNALGISGTCWDVSLMPLRAGYKSSSGKVVFESTSIANALIYAADNGADIINMSFSSTTPSRLEREAIEYCSEAGVLLVASAGNNGVDAPHYPAAYNNVMAVAGISLSGSKEVKYPYTNYGMWIDLSAHASSMYSTKTGGRYGYNSGTSMSSPLVAGAAALIKSVYPSITADQIAKKLRTTAENINGDNIGFENKLGTGKLNVEDAIKAVSVQTKLGVVNLHPVDVTGPADGILSPNERIELRVSVKNFARTQTQVSISLTTEDPYISIIDGEAFIGQIGENQIGSSSDDSFLIAINSNTPKDYQASVDLHLSTQCQSMLSTDRLHLRLNDLCSQIQMLAEQTSYFDFISPEILTHRNLPEIISLYQSNSTYENHIYARYRDTTGSWSSAVRISEGVPAARVPHGILTSDGRAHVIFLAMVNSDGELCYTSRNPATGLWSAPLQITEGAKIYDWTDIPSHDAENFIAASPNGDIHVVWADYRMGHAEFYHIYNNGSSWSGITKAAAPSDQLHSSSKCFFLFDRAGKGYLLWMEQDKSVHMTTFYEGQWSLPKVVATNAGDFAVSVNSQNKLDMVYLLYEASSPIMHQQYNGTTWSSPQMIMSDLYPFGLHMQTASDDSIHLILNDYSTDNLLLTIFDNSSWSAPSPLIYDGIDRNWFYMDFGMGKNDEYYIIGSVETAPSTRNDVLFITSDFESDHFASMPTVIDAGDVTEDTMSISATWSSDHYTGISEYMYAIGTAPGSRDYRNWVSTGTATSIIADVSSTLLQPGQTYYISVKAKNGLGLWSPIGTSDGITCQPDVSEQVGCTKYGGGLGTQSDPYLISTREHMNTIGTESEDWNKHFILTDDIDISQYHSTLYNIIGSSSKPFTGTFNGLGHSISGFNFEIADSFGNSGIGLFGYVDSADAHIQNLTVIEPTINAPTTYTGILAGRMDAGTIINCYIQGGSIVNGNSSGAFAGDNWGNIIRCYSTCTVSGTEDIGSLVGRNFGTIQYCYAAGSASGNFYVGGIAGLNSNSFGGIGLISNSYATGDVTGDYAGGLVGLKTGGDIVKCYSVGNVAEASVSGGLIGISYNGLVKDSFWDSTTSGQNTSAGGTPLTTNDMMTNATFTNAGWEFVSENVNGPNNIWRMCVDGAAYPHLSWEYSMHSDFLCPDGVSIEDLLFLAQNWLKEHQDTPADTNFDSRVDFLDLSIMSTQWLLAE